MSKNAIKKVDVDISVIDDEKNGWMYITIHRQDTNRSYVAYKEIGTRDYQTHFNRAMFLLNKVMERNLS